MTAVRCCGVLELETKFHSKVRNHGEVPYKSLLLVESGYYRFQIWDTMLTFANLRLTFDSSSMVYWGASWEANIPWLVSSPDTQHQHPLPGPQPSQEQLDTLSPLARSCMEVRGRSGRPVSRIHPNDTHVLVWETVNAQVYQTAAQSMCDSHALGYLTTSSLVSNISRENGKSSIINWWKIFWQKISKLVCISISLTKAGISNTALVAAGKLQSNFSVEEVTSVLGLTCTLEWKH